jgi:hypothetical protein
MVCREKAPARKVRSRGYRASKITENPTTKKGKASVAQISKALKRTVAATTVKDRCSSACLNGGYPMTVSKFANTPSCAIADFRWPLAMVLVAVAVAIVGVVVITVTTPCFHIPDGTEPR